MSDPVPLFSVSRLRVLFDGTTVLSIDDLRLEEGQVTVLVGENGSGKTTLLRVLNGLLPPASGDITFRGIRLDAAGLRAVRGQSVLLHQAPLLFRGTVMHNVSYGLKIRSVPRAERIARSRRALARAGLEGLERRRVSGLSGGEKQRVALARALVLEPRVFLLDEPTAHVDPEARRCVERIVREVSTAGATVIMSTHAMETAYRLCDRMVRLEEGRVAPAAENILKGRVERTDDQFTFFRAGDALLRCPARDGDFSVAVLPFDEPILSRDPLESSARNQLRGVVRGVEPSGALLRVSVDCGVMLKALITRASAAELGVETGRGCVVTFKASAVRLY
jgi:tungstate transport system ATP-binding protein